MYCSTLQNWMYNFSTISMPRRWKLCCTGARRRRSHRSTIIIICGTTHLDFLPRAIGFRKKMSTDHKRMIDRAALEKTRCETFETTASKRGYRFGEAFARQSDTRLPKRVMLGSWLMGKPHRDVGRRSIGYTASPRISKRLERLLLPVTALRVLASRLATGPWPLERRASGSREG